MSTIAEVTAIPASGLAHIDALLNEGPGWNWLAPARNTLYYTFTLPASSGNEAAQINGPLSALNAAQRSAVVQALEQIAGITGVRFAATSDDGAADIHFAAGDIRGSTTAGYCATRWGYTASDDTVTSYTADAHVFFDNVEHAGITLAPSVANGGIELILHELGHAMGLKHPFEGSITLPAAQDNTALTRMSYTDVGGPYNSYGSLDLAALMWLYGGDGLGGALGQASPGLYLIGSAAGDTLQGGKGADMLRGAGGPDRLFGGAGIDSALYDLPRASYNISAGNGVVVVQALAGDEDRDTLSGVERLVFRNGALAFDLEGHAGTTARFIGAVFGAAALHIPQYVGIGLQLLDGGTSAAALMQLALDERLGQGFSVAAEVNLLYQNLVGAAPSAADLQHWTGAVASGQFTPVSLALMAADLDLNLAHIDLAGLAATGLAFV